MFSDADEFLHEETNIDFTEIGATFEAFCEVIDEYTDFNGNII